MLSIENLDLRKSKVSILSFLITFSIFIIIDNLGWSLSNNAYFYTLSAISQTIAALIGFLGMFMIFRFQEIQSKQNQFKKELDRYDVKRFNNIDEIKNFIHDSRYDFKDTSSFEEKQFQYLNLCAKYIDDHKKDDYLRVVSGLDNANQFVKYYNQTISIPILLGAIAMILSILFLPFGGIEVPKNITSLSFSPLLLVGFVVSISISFLIVIIISFISILLHREQLHERFY